MWLCKTQVLTAVELEIRNLALRRFFRKGKCLKFKC